MKSIVWKLAAIVAIACSGLPSVNLFAEEPGKQIIEVRTYTLASQAKEAELDAYLENALVPALQRQGLGPIGVLDQAETGEEVQVVLIIPGKTVEAVTMSSKKLAKDETYQKNAADYLATNPSQPVVKRIRSELLEPFDCWPKTKVPVQKEKNLSRLFELRVYESATEERGNVKVDMFNAGEVPIFLAADIVPVFMGQALIGDQMPNLTYMVVFDNADAQAKGWKTFIQHPDWKVLSKDPKYKKTVSKIHKSMWVPKSYSQL